MQLAKAHVNLLFMGLHQICDSASFESQNALYYMRLYENWTELPTRNPDFRDSVSELIINKSIVSAELIKILGVGAILGDNEESDELTIALLKLRKFFGHLSRQPLECKINCMNKDACERRLA